MDVSAIHYSEIPDDTFCSTCFTFILLYNNYYCKTVQFTTKKYSANAFGNFVTFFAKVLGFKPNLKLKFSVTLSFHLTFVLNRVLV